MVQHGKNFCERLGELNDGIRLDPENVYLTLEGLSGKVLKGSSNQQLGRRFVREYNAVCEQNGGHALNFAKSK